MIAQFRSLDSLARAFDELIRFGVVEQRIAPHFEEVEAVEIGPNELLDFLKRIHAWAHPSSVENIREGLGRRSLELPVFREHGGTLDIKSPPLELRVMEIILRHEGQLLG